MLGRIPIAYVRMLHDFLAARGMDAARLLGQPCPPNDPHGLQAITVRRWAELLALAGQATGIEHLGLRLGASVDARYLGVVGYLTRHCATLGQALKRYNEFESLLADINPGRMRFDLRGVSITWDMDRVRTTLQVDACNFAMLAAYARQISGQPELQALELRLMHPAPADVTPYTDFFGCPVHFGHPVTVLRLSYGTLARRIPQPDDTLRELLEVQARERLSQLPPPDPFLAELHRIVAGLLPDGRATLDECARRCACTPRTLQRRLETSQIGFQAVLDEVRQHLADSYMMDGRIKLSEVAQLLGFADQAAFTRAFRRWKGVPPSRWRRQLGAGLPEAADGPSA